MTTERLSLRIDADLKKTLEREAKREERPISYLAVKAIEAMFGDRAEKRAAIQTAIVEADDWAFISHDAVDAWISSWDTDSELPPPKPNILSGP